MKKNRYEKYRATDVGQATHLYHQGQKLPDAATALTVATTGSSLEKRTAAVPTLLFVRRRRKVPVRSRSLFRHSPTKRKRRRI